MAYVLSLIVGLAVGIAYGFLGVRSPAPPVIALLGLRGMLAGEMLVSHLRGHSDAMVSFGHSKSFSPRERAGKQLSTSTKPPAGTAS